MDGANMNAQVGPDEPGGDRRGRVPSQPAQDVCHSPRRRRPGMGPIARGQTSRAVSARSSRREGWGDRAIPAVAAAPWGSASILLISYGYIRMLGARHDGCDAFRDPERQLHQGQASESLRRVVRGHNGRVAHEMIFDLRPFKAGSGPSIDEQDVAKRLMDYGFHAPTVSFPVAGTMMIEPTESESKLELDRFCDALIAIRKEIQAVIDGRAHATDNVLKNAPHTADAVSPTPGRIRTRASRRPIRCRSCARPRCGRPSRGSTIRTATGT